MKKLFLMLLIFSCCTFLYGQSLIVKKPKPPIVTSDGEVFSDFNELNKIDKKRIKMLYNGVNDEMRDSLVKRFGVAFDTQSEFIFFIDLDSTNKRLTFVTPLLEKSKKEAATNTVKPLSLPEGSKQLDINDVASDFEVPMLDGTNIRLANLKGKVVLINFWATWCGPCLKEFYDVPEDLLAPLKVTDFVFLPIAVAENKEKVSQKMNQLHKDGLQFNVGWDENKSIWHEYGGKGIPRNILIDKKGIIRYISIGNVNGNLEKIVEEVKKLQAE